jgi:hypothetical protein
MSANGRKTIALAMVFRKLNEITIREEVKMKIKGALKAGNTQEAEEMKKDLQVWEEKDVLEVEFDIDVFFKAFKIEKSPAGVAGLLKTLDEITGAKAGIVHTDNYIEFLTWIQYARIGRDNKKIEIKFSEDIIKYINTNERGYCELLLEDIADLKSFYAFRWLEIIQSYESLKGQKGNKNEHWFIMKEIKDIRSLFRLEKGYERTESLKRKVIEEPIKEINDSKIGIKLEVEYIPDEKDKRRLEKIKIRAKRLKKREKITIKYESTTEEGNKIEVSQEIGLPNKSEHIIKADESDFKEFLKSRGAESAMDFVIRLAKEKKAMQTETSN